jgi:hypothetical protein
MLFGETKLQSPILYSKHMLTDGNEMFAASCKLGFEGIISKNAEAPYRSDRNEGWLKVKCVQKGKFPVIGFVKDPTGVAALYLGKKEGKELRYMGKVGIKDRRPREKLLAYAKSALSWAYSNARKTGFKPTGARWSEIQPPEVEGKNLTKLKIDQAILHNRKKKFTVRHVGEVLACSEAFCADRTSNQKISPGIRFGIWWWALTANRRGSTAHLERANVVENDPYNDLPAWGSAFWDAGEMKSRRPFLVGVPPIGMRVIDLAISDWQVLVTESHSKDHTSKWVFASTRRVQRLDVADDLDTDVPIHPSSLADYIRNMRGINPSSRIGGLADWRIGGLADWRIGGLADFRDSRFR